MYKDGELVVYDLMGQRVRSLALGTLDFNDIDIGAARQFHVDDADHLYLMSSDAKEVSFSRLF